MSFCPTDDIHSIYLDNELPENYRAEYEAHLKVCPKCQKKVNDLKMLNSLFDADSKSITPDSHFLDQSYERLMARMSYTKNIHKAEKKSYSNIKYGFCAAAAAAVFALVIPLRINSNRATVENQNVSVASVSAQIQPASNVSVGGGNGVVISGNLQGQSLSSVSVNNNYGNGFTQNVSTGNSNAVGRMLFTDFDVFRPDFSESTGIAIRITVPGMNVMPAQENLPDKEAGQSE